MKYCKNCQTEVDVIIEQTPTSSIHYAKNICSQCDAFIDWAKKPDNEGRRTKGSKFTPEYLEIDHCELCGRTRDKLGDRETLATHHKIPEEEGGLDERKNILVLCTPCHRIAHFLRTYLHRHLDGFYTFYNENK